MIDMDPKKHNSCFVFPLHPPKFEFGKKLIESYNHFWENDEIFVIFSSKYEEELFNTFYGKSCQYKSIIIEPKTKWPPSEKKILGVKYIFDNFNYQYVGVIDSECLFIKKDDIHERFKNKYESKTFYCSFATNELVLKIITAPLRFFSEKDSSQLYKFLSLYNPYHWFNDVPIYKREDFYDFLTDLKVEDKISNFVWEDFDYVFYSYYLLLKKEFNFEMLKVEDKILSTKLASALEYQERYPKDFFKNIFLQMSPMWARTKEDYMNEVFILVHVEQGHHEL